MALIVSEGVFAYFLAPCLVALFKTQKVLMEYLTQFFSNVTVKWWGFVFQFSWHRDAQRHASTLWHGIRRAQELFGYTKGQIVFVYGHPTYGGFWGEIRVTSYCALRSSLNGVADVQRKRARYLPRTDWSATACAGFASSFFSEHRLTLPSLS